MMIEPATYSLRFLHGDRKIHAIKLVRELTQLGLAECRDLVDQQGVFLRGLEHDAATAIAHRFGTEAAAKIAILAEAQYRYGFDPHHLLRGDQPLIRLVVSGPLLAWEHGRSGEWIREREQRFEHGAARDEAIANEFAEWSARGLEIVERELDIVRATSARAPQLEQSIRESDSPDELMAIHADWLQRQGDPRGLLAALDLARVRAESRKRPRLDQAFLDTLVEHPHIVGPLLHVLGLVRLDWRGGLVVGIHFDRHEHPRADLDMLEGLLALPVCACLRSLRVNSAGAGGPAFATKLTHSDPALLGGLRELALSSHYEFEGFIDWSRLPRLERLELVCGAMTPIHLPDLRTLELTLWRPDAAVVALRESRLPRLRSLILRFDSGAFHGGWPEASIGDSLASLFALPLIRSLTSLTLHNEGEPWPRWVAQTIVDAPTLHGGTKLHVRDVDFEPDARALFGRLSS